MDNVFIMRNFVAAIINKAISDWVKHPKRKTEIREFFQSDWGKECCDILDLSAKDILTKLENNKINMRVLEEVA